MKQITYRELQQSAKWMKYLPVELTRYGKVVAIISKPPTNSDPQPTPQTEIKAPTPAPEPVYQHEPPAPPVTGRCIIPFCRGYGPYRDDFSVWDEVFGEDRTVKGFVCNTHYKKR